MGYAQTISDRRDHALAIGNIASLQANTGDLTGAFQSLKIADDQDSRDWIRLWIVGAQAKSGDFDAAWKTFKSIKGEQQRQVALKGIALQQAKHGELESAIVTANKMGAGYAKSEGLTDIAVFLMNAGDRIKARTVFERAIVSAREGNEAGNGYLVFTEADRIGKIAEVRAKAGDSISAIDDLKNEWGEIEKTPNLSDKVTALYYLGCAQADVGDIVGAIASSDEIDLHPGKGFTDTLPCGLSDLKNLIVDAQIRASDIHGAHLTLAKISDPDSRVAAICAISVAQFHSGNEEEANRMLATALEEVPKIEIVWVRREALEEIGDARYLTGDEMGARTLYDEATKGLDEGKNESMSDYEAQLLFSKRKAAGDLKGAINAASKIGDPGTRLFVFRRMGSDFVKSGKTDRAFQLLDEDISPLTKVYVLMGMVDGLTGVHEN
jgi:tetratricopeptide (TPR) repeat protein